MIIRTLFLLLIFITNTYGQSFLGFATKNVNLRERPTTESIKITTLNSGTALFIIDIEDKDGFYNVIVIDSNQEGYVHKSFVKLDREIPKNTEGIFNPIGKSRDVISELNVFNNTSKNLTLKLNHITYSFSPKEKRKITLAPGKYEYRASASGVIPDYGSEYIESNMNYEWEFYITRR